MTRTAPKRSKIKQSQADLRFLTEAEFATVARSAGDLADLLRVAVGTGLRFGELTALRVSDINVRHRTATKHGSVTAKTVRTTSPAG